MPDYDLSSDNQVSVKVYGKVLDERYTYILFNHPELDLEIVYLIDQIQKGKGGQLSAEAIKYLRKHKLVEGRINNLYLSASVSQAIDDEAGYIKNKAFDDQYYKDLIVRYLQQYGKAKKKDIRNLLWDKLPDVLSEEQKEYKIGNLLAALRKQDIICPNSTNQQRAYWVLK